jgi:hypothetical protein
MIDPLAARRALDRAARACAIMSDELVAEVFATLEARLHGDWAGTGPADSAGRELAYRQLRALQDFKAEFARMLSDGRVAERDLANMGKGQLVQE